MLCCDVRGLDVRKFPVIVEVKGSPVVVTPNQLGFNYKEQIPLFDLGYYMRNSGTITREFKLSNTGPKDIELGNKYKQILSFIIKKYKKSGKFII